MPLRERLGEHVARADRTRNAFIVEAIEEKLAKEEAVG
jgi:predicted transcriptional regulator